MIYFTFIGNHDAISASGSFGAVTNIFLNYKDELTKVFFFITPGTNIANYPAIANDNANLIKQSKEFVEIEFIQLKLPNPVDYDIVYPVMLNEVSTIIEKYNLQDEPKIINITSGTPTMTACWILLSQSGIIKNAKLIQSFEKRFSRDGKTTFEVNFDIDDFPKINAPDQLKRQLTILSRENKKLSQRLNEEELSQKIPGIIGKSKKILEIKDQILNQIDSRTHVLILGETGSGKEVVAQTIWQLYHKPDDTKLEILDCGSISQNLIESELFGHVKGAFTGADKLREGILKKCNGKMIFLDEIGNLPKEGQQKLLRVLSNGEIRKLGSDSIDQITIQVIAATNKNVEDESIFANDIKNRFDEIIFLPPLRERKEDILLLLDHFIRIESKLNNISSPIELSSDIKKTLLDYSWPDNIRGLEKWVQQLLRRFKTGGYISLTDLPQNHIERFQKESKKQMFLPELPLNIPIEEYIELIRTKARKQADGNNSEVDRLLQQKVGTEKVRQHRKRNK
jgi:transcriptional regulator with GAF, ATPase, and Fis domain